jgi:hypothetical protein
MLLALDLSLSVFLRYAVEQRRLVKEGIDEIVAEEAWQRRPSYAFYAIAIGVGFLFPTVGVALSLAIALFLAVPARTVHRLLRPGRPHPPTSFSCPLISPPAFFAVWTLT